VLRCVPVAPVIRTLIALALALPLTTLVLTPPLAKAAGSGTVECLLPNPDTGECDLEVWGEPGTDGNYELELTSAGGNARWCYRTPPRTVADGEEGPEWVECNGGEKGWYSQRFDCYFTNNERHVGWVDPLSPLVEYPDAETMAPDPAVEPGDEGQVYLAQCYFEHYNTGAGWFAYAYWFLPDGISIETTPDPTIDLIVEAHNNLQLRAATVGTAPPEGSAGLVRLPVWLWNTTDEHNWGERSASASAAGVTVFADARADQIIWDMGDGGEPVVCDEGQQFTPEQDPNRPPCGYRYHSPSRGEPGGVYTVTATTVWQITWWVEGGPMDGETHTITLQPETGTTVRINELQVLVGRSPL
jgi:hypothetical protein